MTSTQTRTNITAVENFLQQASVVVTGLAPLLAPIAGAGAVLPYVGPVIAAIEAILALVGEVAAQNGPPTVDQWAALLKARDAAIAQATAPAPAAAAPSA